MPGPIPNRSTDYSRARDASKRGEITKGKHYDPIIPDIPDDWHPTCKKLWDAVRNSGQSYFYQESDWMVLYSLMEDLSLMKKAGRMNGQVLATIYTNLTSLGLTEGDRRRMRIELERDDGVAVDDEVEAIDFYQGRLTAVPNL